MQLVYYYKSRRKAADAIQALLGSPARPNIRRVCVLVEANGGVSVFISFAPGANEMDSVRVEGIFATGKQSSGDFSELITSLNSYREIYIGQGVEMFRGHSWAPKDFE